MEEQAVPVEVDDDLSLPPPSILLVDDRPANLLALEAVLEPLGHRIVKVGSGEEALRKILAEDFAVILMDVQMPGMDGFQTVAMIKQRQKNVHVPIIFVSAVAKEVQDISMGYSYGAVDYITKPFDPDVLKAKVSVLVALHLQAERIARQRELLAEKRHELHRRQAERDEAERANRLKDEFLAFVSHELRTPLNAIVGWTELLSRGQLDPVSTRRAIETIRRNAELQTILVEDLIALSQMVLGSLRLNVQPVDLRSVVATSIATLGPIAEAKGVRLEYEPPGDDADCIADPKRLHQVLCNLLSNAVKFTAPGGHVAVRLGDDDEDGWLRVEVADDGVGIRREALPHVFERFWQDRTLAGSEAGLGLGLAVVRQLVDLHGGRVSAESDGEGQGTRITVRLRRNVEPASMTA